MREKVKPITAECLLYGCEFFRYDEKLDRQSCIADEDDPDRPCVELEASE